VAVTMPWLDPSVAASPVMAPGGSDIGNPTALAMDAAATKKAMDDAAAASRVTTEKETMDAAAMKKALDDEAVTEGATADKRATNAVAAKKATDDTTVAEKATTEAAA
jgi:hypothetical protein